MRRTFLSPDTCLSLLSAPEAVITCCKQGFSGKRISRHESMSRHPDSHSSPTTRDFLRLILSTTDPSFFLQSSSSATRVETPVQKPPKIQSRLSICIPILNHDDEEVAVPAAVGDDDLRLLMQSVSDSRAGNSSSHAGRRESNRKERQHLHHQDSLPSCQRLGAETFCLCVKDTFSLSVDGVCVSPATDCVHMKSGARAYEGPEEEIRPLTHTLLQSFV